MKETVHFTDRQKAVIRAIIKQYEENLAMGLVKYDPIKATQYFAETGELTKYGLDIRTQFEVLHELSAMDLGIEIIITKDDFDPEKRCVTDALGYSMYLRDDSDELEQTMFDIRYHFGSVRIITESITNINRLKNMCEEGYNATLTFIDDCNYRVECSRGKDFHEIYSFPALHAGKRPQLILKYAIDHMDDENPTISKDTLNKKVLKNSTSLAPIIGPKESISSSIFDDTSMAVLSYFFDFGTSSIRFRGYTRKDLTGADIAVFEEYGVKQ